jgi:hypothetical protein
MTPSKKLIRRQAAVIEDLFAGELKEPEVLQKHHVSPSLFERWLSDERFTEQLERRIAHAYRQSRMILASHAPAAATRLMQLMQSQSQETARKACLDILALHGPVGEQESPTAPAAAAAAPAPSASTLSPKIASRLLAALARAEPPTEASPT